jgi:hypothetical protein
MKPISLFLMLYALLAADTSYADIIDFKHLSIDLTNSDDATAKASWSDPNRITVSKDGLGWDGDRVSSMDGWIQTKPIALGMSWRPTYAISVRCAIQPPSREFTLDNGQKSTPDAGDVYVRFSPDRVHWSTWQALERAEPQSADEKKTPGRYYNGTVRVAYRDRSEYSKLLSDYSERDVPWKSDEEAAVKWIIGRDADFFAKHIPFIGYVEFLYEPGFYGGQRIRNFKADISYGMGGMHAIPKDESVTKNRDVPWRFEGKE